MCSEEVENDRFIKITKIIYIGCFTELQLVLAGIQSLAGSKLVVKLCSLRRKEEKF